MLLLLCILPIDAHAGRAAVRTSDLEMDGAVHNRKVFVHICTTCCSSWLLNLLMLAIDDMLFRIPAGTEYVRATFVAM